MPPIPTNADTVIPAMICTAPMSPAPLVKSLIPVRLAARIKGRPSKNEYRAASALRMSRNRPAVIVTPEREVPGNRAIAWATPITIVSARRRSLICRLRRDTRSDMSAATAKPASKRGDDQQRAILVRFRVEETVDLVIAQ